MATLEKHVKDRHRGKEPSSSAKPPHGRKGSTEKPHMKMDVNERGSREHGKEKDCR